MNKLIRLTIVSLILGLSVPNFAASRSSSRSSSGSRSSSSSSSRPSTPAPSRPSTPAPSTPKVTQPSLPSKSTGPSVTKPTTPSVQTPKTEVPKQVIPPKDNTAAKVAVGAVAGGVIGASVAESSSVAPRVASNTDTKQKSESVKSGGITKDQALNKFKQENSAKYQTKFSSEPAKRPDYVPATTKVDGKDYNVTYNQHHGGYGYYSGNTWNSYSPMTDMLMLSMLMNASQPDVVYVKSGQITQPQTVTKIEREKSGSGMVFLILVVGCIVAVGFMISRLK